LLWRRQLRFAGRKQLHGVNDMNDKIYNVLFLCTGNTARSILAKSILRKLGVGKFAAFSAGSQPKGVVNPYAVATLEACGFPIDGLRSKSWEEFSPPGAPKMDFIFTVCDSAAGETCPVWPGHPLTTHWGIEDPAAVNGSDVEKQRAFTAAFQHLKNRIELIYALPLHNLDTCALAARLREIGELDDATQQSNRME
jgi:arsenate reductase